MYFQNSLQIYLVNQFLHKQTQHNKTNKKDLYQQLQNDLDLYFHKYRTLSQSIHNSYQFQRLLYLSILQHKLARSYHSQIPQKSIKYYIHKIKSIIPNISVIYNKNSNIESLINQKLQQFEISLQNNKIRQIDFKILLNKQMDQVFVLIIRKIIYDMQISLKQTYANVQNIDNNLEYHSELVYIVGEFFQQRFCVYKLLQDKINIPTHHDDSIFIGYINKKYYIFYQYKPIIRLISQKKISLQDQLSKIKTKDKSPENSYQINATQIKLHIQSKSSTKYKTPLKSQHKQKCSTCNSNISKTKHLIYNYKYYCQKCILDPQMQLQDIPIHKIQKFIKQNSIKKFRLPIQCPQCNQNTIITDYDALNKPRIIQCKKCFQYICLKHNIISSACFCFCSKCKYQTYKDLNLKLKVCLKCKNKCCINCKKINNKCLCRCPYCSQIKGSENCLCSIQFKCHDCQNRSKFMMDCVCGGKLCRPCAFENVKTRDKRTEMFCSKMR